ncbi:MAG TPA: glycosyltransferase family 9 protein [Ignavibacteriales bacterium]|nr:glycosyltransferase family 9 protein [Ignavibacteriales bacterium]
MKKVLIVRQHNQLGDMLAGISLFRAIKEKNPATHIALIVSPANCIAVEKNKYIDRLFIFDKKKLFTLKFLKELFSMLRDNYDAAIVPSTVSISFTSGLLARLSKAKTYIGPGSLDGRENKSAYLFDRRIDLNWKKYPDANVADFCLDIIRPFGYNTADFSSSINFDKKDLNTAENFLKEIGYTKEYMLIGLHVGAGKPPNRWSLKKFIELIEKLNAEYKAKFFLTGSAADNEELKYIQEHSPIPAPVYMNKKIPEVAALISLADLFVTNDTGIMHVAGATSVPQVSIFGPTNPFNWAPIGANKIFIKKSDLIDEIEVNEVFELCRKLVKSGSKAVQA